MRVPAALTSAAEAGAAINTYLAWDTTDLVVGGFPLPLPHPDDRRIATAEHRVNQLMDELAAHPGPGPAVLGHLPGDAPRPIGKPTFDRAAITITEPLGSDYGLVVESALPELAELVANVRMVRLLAARAATCAAADRARPGRTRQAERLEAEATALTDYASDLERHIRPLGDHFLDRWRAEAARRSPEPSPNVLTRSAELRRPSK